MKALIERNVRHNDAVHHRNLGSDSEVEDIKRDLIEILEALINHIHVYQSGQHPLMQFRAHMEAYIERAIYYTTQEYPREYRDRPNITSLWDILKSIQYRDISMSHWPVPIDRG